MKKKVIFISTLYLLTIITVIAIIIINKIDFKDYHNEYYSLKYDTTWKYLQDNQNFKLEHKKSGGKLTILTKQLEDYYIDTKLSVLIDDIISSIQEQNKEYKLISTYEDEMKYESMSYLFEKDNEQVLVKVCKNNQTILIITYENQSKYFDIVLDSVDNIVNSIEMTSK